MFASVFHTNIYGEHKERHFRHCLSNKQLLGGRAVGGRVRQGYIMLPELKSMCVRLFFHLYQSFPMFFHGGTSKIEED